jgi:hypothetical protein
MYAVSSHVKDLLILKNRESLDGMRGAEFAHGAIQNEDWLFSTYRALPIKLYGFPKKK